MAKSTIIEKRSYTVKYVKNSNFFKSKIFYRPGTVKINETLPFRIKFTNVGIPGYGPSGAAPIGIAIIGLNNYVL
jgi:hypothetical protein